MSGKRYPDEFKIEAVKQVVNRGRERKLNLTLFE
jgi:transposase-like protein